VLTRARRRRELNEIERARKDAEDRLGRLSAAYDTALAETGVVLFQRTAEGQDAFHVSASCTATLGWAPSTFLTPGVLRGLVHPDDLAIWDAAIGGRTVIDLTHGTDPAARVTSPALGADPSPVVRLRSATGPWRHVRVETVSSADGPTRGALVDVTSDQSRGRTVRRFAEVIERDPSACLLLRLTETADPSSLVIEAANRAAHELFHLDPGVVGDDAATTPIDTVLGAASAQLLRAAAFDVAHTGEPMTAERLALLEVPGTYLDLRLERLTDGALALRLTDVTATAALEDRLRHQASHDALTGLPNRSLFEDRLASALSTASPDAPAALVLIDIDRLRDHNDALGLHLGDDLLVQFGRRLVREVRGAAVVSRIGGDEFAVLTLPCAGAAEATERANAVRAALAAPFDLDGHLVHVRSSIGVALTPTHGSDTRTALRVAQRALDAAKTAPDGLVVHDGTEPEGSIHRLGLLSELRQGLANRDLELRYQPVLDLRSGRVTKVEAVLRWRQERHDARLPVEFLELAEHSGLIQPLTRWVLGEAADAAAGFARSGHDVVVSTNLSLRNLFDPDLERFLVLLIDSGELDPGSVELEVAETELMDDPVRSREVLVRLHTLGLRIVVDEFGTGYTSLATMQHLPVSGLKIDRSFVTAISDDPADASIVRSTIELCHDLGLGVAAEGVADAGTLSMLAAFGCDLAQGPHLSEPVTSDALPARITELESAARAFSGAVPR